MIQLEWLMDQIDLYCAQGAEEVAAEEDSTMTYKEAYRDYLEQVIDEAKGRLGRLGHLNVNILTSGEIMK